MISVTSTVVFTPYDPPSSAINEPNNLLIKCKVSGEEIFYSDISKLEIKIFKKMYD